MVGSTEEQFKQWSNLLQNFGSEPIYIGSVGTAAATKLALNQLIASLTTAFALSLSLVQNQGVEVEKFIPHSALQKVVSKKYEKDSFDFLENSVKILGKRKVRANSTRTF